MDFVGSLDAPSLTCPSLVAFDKWILMGTSKKLKLRQRHISFKSYSFFRENARCLWSQIWSNRCPGLLKVYMKRNHCVLHQMIKVPQINVINMNNYQISKGCNKCQNWKNLFVLRLTSTRKALRREKCLGHEAKIVISIWISVSVNVFYCITSD